MFFGGLGGLFQAYSQCSEPVSVDQNKIYLKIIILLSDMAIAMPH